jgi:hypothetical protein
VEVTVNPLKIHAMLIEEKERKGYYKAYLFFISPSPGITRSLTLMLLLITYLEDPYWIFG